MRLLPKNSDLGWVAYGWLLYLLFLFLPALFGHKSVWFWVLTILSICAFLPLYFWQYRLQGRRKLWAIGGMTALGCACARFNPSSLVYFIFAACFIGEAVEPAVAFRYLGALLAVIAAESWILGMPPGYWIPTLLPTAVLGASMIHFAQQRRMNQKLKLAQDEVEHLAKVAERERIARDLHDLLGHTLSVIVLKSELASKLAEKDPARAMEEIREVERISREALAQVRSAVKGYRSVGLESELSRVRQTLETAGIEVDSALERIPLSPAQETVLALALREGVTNVIRHAQASSCRLRLREAGGCCELEIADNGRGGATPDGAGLSGMRQRVEALGGTLEIDGSTGTALRVRLPLRASEASGAA